MKLPAFSTAFFAAAALLTFVPVAVHAQAVKAGWTDNQTKALAQAKVEKKLVLMDFTGSDWCSWCIRMDKEVFDTAEFKDYAKDKLVLVEVDYPHQKAQSPQVKKQNEALQTKYNVEGYPTMIVVDGDGKTVKVFDGYQEGGAKGFVEQLKKLKA